MRVIVAGSRGITDKAVVMQALRDAFLWEGINPTCIVSGTARGVDRLGEEIARSAGLRIDSRPADWNRHGKRAGFLRNEEMADNADALVAVWDGSSPGTKHMIAAARARGLLVHVYQPA